ncbi:MAG: UDP-N-acetylglucosamine--N-acetylmuramyl-(pentapeptide) pyrophosphoryl-undecaprenol N-acetylglucosamine transferase, partial [Dehalococcoidia bacterium]|nr:UDP-N-acetylglucosamine--N-acetylmuramyl-(pentapeptide) pyrophosphoryl-undecaprenol N-acetylglucosamine transferase [Dehalococcoidia bacterium]
MTQAAMSHGMLRLAVAGGGTAGHVYPALAVISAWRKMVGPEAPILYLGSGAGIEEVLVERAGIPFSSIQAGPLRGKNPLVVACSIIRLAWGVGQAWKALSDFQPHVLLATGGYVSIPAALAARLRRVSLALYLPDIEPGWAIRFMATLARRIAVTSAASKAYLPASKVIETGYPVRDEVWGLDKSEARRRLGLEVDFPTLLVMGGSRGARSINRAVSEALEPLLQTCQVIHICGPDDEDWLRERASRLEETLAARYFLYPYLHSLFPSALASADLVLSRAGASVLGEYPAVGLPSLLVPYPYAGSHQEKNACFLSQAGAAQVIRNGQVSSLHVTVKGLLEDRERLAQMSREALNLRRPQAAQDIATMLV